MKFSLWLEKRDIKDAIMGALDADLEEEDDLLDRKTTYFGPEVRSKLKNLGVVKNTNDNMGRYGEIVKSIDDGITIAELIKKIEG